MMKYTALLLLLALCLLSCDSENEPLIDQATYGYEYFPLRVGQERIYLVDSIRFDVGDQGLPVSDSSRFYMRELYVESFKNQLDEDVFRIERYRARNLGDPWEIIDVVTESRNLNQSFHTENNLRFVNLVFPVQKGVRWNGNSFFDEDLTVFVRGEGIKMFKNWEYEVLEEGATVQVGDTRYDEVATIQQADDENEIEIRRSFEQYAKGFGLISRERWIMNSYCKEIGTTEQCVGLSWREKAGRGFILRQTLVDYK